MKILKVLKNVKVLNNYNNDQIKLDFGIHKKTELKKRMQNRGKYRVANCDKSQ